MFVTVHVAKVITTGDSVGVGANKMAILIIDMFYTNVPSVVQKRQMIMEVSKTNEPIEAVPNNNLTHPHRPRKTDPHGSPVPRFGDAWQHGERHRFNRVGGFAPRLKVSMEIDGRKMLK